MQNKICVFDFDGVLGNSRDVGYAMHNNINEKYSLPKITNREEYLNVIDNGHLKEKIDSDSITNYYLECNDYYSKRLKNITLFPAIKELLKSSPKDIIIISSSPDSFIKEILKQEGIEDVTIYGKETAKSKKERFEMLLKDRDINKEDIIYIGDTIDDYKFCNQVGISMIGSNYGYSNLEEIKDYLLLLVHSSEELVEVVKQYMLVRW